MQGALLFQVSLFLKGIEEKNTGYSHSFKIFLKSVNKFFLYIIHNPFVTVAVVDSGKQRNTAALFTPGKVP